MPASYGGASGGSSGPTTPASALLDAASPNEVVILDESGEGASASFEDVATTGIAEALSDAAEGDFLVATGAGEVQRASVDPAAVRGVIGAAASGGTPWGSTVVDGLLGGGWSAAATPAGTSVTWTASTLVLSVPSGVSGTVRQQHDDEIADGATAWDLAVRLQATTGSGTTTAAVGVYWIFDGGATQYFGVNVRGDGAIYVGWATPTSGSDAYAATTLSLGGGQSWVRLSRTEAGQKVVWYGEGSGGALPTQWARRYVLDTAEGASVRPVAVQLVASGVGGAPSVDWVATVRAVRTTSVGSL